MNIIVCIARNGAIGKNNGLLYHLRADLINFKHITTGHTVIMGRKTFESLPKGALPNRRNIVLTHSEITFSNTEVFHSLDEALKHCKEDEIFVIGGGSVYSEALPYAKRLYLTEVDDNPTDADTFFPEIDKKEWKELSREHYEADEQNDKPYDFVVLERV